jgi:GrpB-like predicted nucleotidyltransferase (UPF0157 family)
MELKDKYIFRPYNPIFPKLFQAERERLQKVLGEDAQIDHIGSTAVPGLGGKGVIDISVAVSKNKWPEISEKLKSLGYEYKKKETEREKERLFFMANLPDEELGTRLYHIHLSYPESPELLKQIGFRDYLRIHPEATKEYAEIKKLAAETAQKFKTKNEMRDTYEQVKKDFIESILKKLQLSRV